MSRLFLKILCPLILLLGSTGGVSKTEEFQVPSLTTPVMDQAGILQPQTVQKLDHLLRQVYEAGGSQLVVLTVPTLGMISVEEAGIKVVDQWKLGQKGKDNGILLLIAPHDRRVRIEVGRGLEGTLTDAYSRRIIDQIIKPAFKEGNFDSGVMSASLAIIQVSDPEFDLSKMGYSRTKVRASSGSGRNPLVQILVLILFFFFVLLAILMRFLQAIGLMPRHTGMSSYGSSRRSSGFGWGSSGGFGSGGGGGWSGGGGGFSGGGSSGSW